MGCDPCPSKTDSSFSSAVFVQLQAEVQQGQASHAGDRIRRLRRDVEIFCANDNPSQVERARRARRKWKNSTPSRKRRFIISGLVIISARMEAIFEGRK